MSMSLREQLEAKKAQEAASKAQVAPKVQEVQEVTPAPEAPKAEPKPALELTGQTDQIISRDHTLESTGEKLGVFSPYDPRLELREIAGTRVVKCLYKTMVAGKKVEGGRENSYVRVPTKHLEERELRKEEVLGRLLPHVRDWLESLEDTDIKADHKEGALSVYTDKLSIEALLDALDTKAEGTGSRNRLSGEKIKAWFESSGIARMVGDLVASKMVEGAEAVEDLPESVQVKALAVVAGYGKKFQSLANVKLSLDKVEADKMISLVEVAVEMRGDKMLVDDKILCDKLVVRLKVAGEKEQELLFDLGF